MVFLSSFGWIVEVGGCTGQDSLGGGRLPTIEDSIFGGFLWIGDTELRQEKRRPLTISVRELKQKRRVLESLAGEALSLDALASHLLSTDG